MKTRIYLACVFLYFFCSVMLHAQNRRYVKPYPEYDAQREMNNLFSADFSSWDYASSDLQFVIDISSPGDEIWVAAGEYSPFYTAELPLDLEYHTSEYDTNYDRVLERINYIEYRFWYVREVLYKYYDEYIFYEEFESHDYEECNERETNEGFDAYIECVKYKNYEAFRENLRKYAFVLKDGVKIYGGFNPDTDERWSGVSVLKGSIQSISQPEFIYHTHHVVIAANCNEGTILDGFTIEGGNANGTDSMFVNEVEILNHCGGGIYNGNSQGVRYSNLRVVWNEATMNGGGIYEGGGSSSCISNCYIQANTAGFGGGVYCIYNSSNDMRGRTRIASSLISGNKAIYRGGALYNTASSPTLVNVTISGNYCQENESYFSGIYNANDPCTSLTAHMTIWNSVLYKNGDYDGSSSIGIYNEFRASYNAGDSFINMEAGNTKTNYYENDLSRSRFESDPEFYNPANYCSAPTTEGDYYLNNIDDFWGLSMAWEYYCSMVHSIHPYYWQFDYTAFFDLGGMPLNERDGIGAFVYWQYGY